MDKLKGKIIVRTGKEAYERTKIGKIYRATGTSYSSGGVEISGGWSIKKGEVNEKEKNK